MSGGDRRLARSWLVPPRRVVETFLASADVRLDGSRPWDIRVRDERFFARMLADGAIGVGEAYMDGWWESDALDELATRVFGARLEAKMPLSPGLVLSGLHARIADRQTRRRSHEVMRRHYDLVDICEAFLDPFLQYSCAYFKDTASLNEAQEKKLDLICRKLQIAPGDRVLDLGCGKGGFAKFAASRYGCAVTGVNLSGAEVTYARALCAGLPVTIEHRDYRDVTGAYDRILVCGMIEHVGYKNYRSMMQKVHDLLAPGGIFLLHTIGDNVTTRRTNPWLDRYIFPNAVIPSMKQLTAASEGLFVVEDWHNFGPDYDRTLLCWFKNLERRWPALDATYGDRYFRMMKFYFLSCAGEFRSRAAQLWQIVMTTAGMRGGYAAQR